MPEEVTGHELDRDVRAALASLGAYTAKRVAQHLVMVAMLLDEDADLAWQHALAARAGGARVGVVREAAGLAAYRAGHYAEALAELRTHRRLTGSAAHLPVMADCERGLGRPERALAMAASPEAARLDQPERVELAIVAAGARADLGELDAAVLTLQLPELQTRSTAPWVSRLRHAYASALAAAGRQDEATTWATRTGVTLDVDEEDDDVDGEVVDLLEDADGSD